MPTAIITPPPTLPQSTQRALVQQALASTNGAQIFGQLNGSSTALSLARQTLSLHRDLAASCVNGQESTTTQTSPTTVSLTLDVFYDAACTQLYYIGAFTATAPSATQVVLNGSYTYYTTAGVIYEYASPTIITVTQLSTSSLALSIQSTIAPSVGAAPIGSFGVGCQVATASDACSIAAVAHGPSDVGAFATATATVTSGATSTTIGLSGNGGASTGPVNAVSIAPVTGSPYAFALAGGTVVDTVTESGSLSLTNAGALSGGSITVSDAADNANVAVTFNATSGAFTGTLTQTSSNTVLATFTVSSSGNGTIAYTGGGSGTITNWNATN